MQKLKFFYEFFLTLNLITFFILQTSIIIVIILFSIKYIDNIDIVVNLLTNSYQKLHEFFIIFGEKIILIIPHIYDYFNN